MANPKHLTILKRGVGAWNLWRRENPEVIPDFNQANLNEAKLSGARLANADLSQVLLRNAMLYEADLSKSNLTSAKLTRANASGAKLSGSNLSLAVFFGADLSRADLQGANLNGANLRNANLTEANLNRAKLDTVGLQGANLSNAKLNGASLRGAVLQSTVFGNTDLTEAIGLEWCHHAGHSVIDQRTLARSGNLPRKFLEGCGLTDELIEYFPSLLDGTPIKFYSCFISYSSKNEEFAQKLYLDLRNKRIRGWFAPEDLKIGDKMRESIDQSIRLYDKLLLILSKYSIESPWVEKEVETALERERQQKRTIVFPVRLDNTVLKIESGWAADIRRSRNIGDFRRWRNVETYKKVFNRLVKDLQA